MSYKSEVKAPANKEPKIGPVQEKETNAKVNAMKKIPMTPPTLSAEDTLLVNPLGKVISQKPKNENAKNIKMTKKATFSHAFVDMSLRIFGSIESNR